MSHQPALKRLTRLLVAKARQRIKAVSELHFLTNAQEVGSEKTVNKVERGRTRPARNRETLPSRSSRSSSGSRRNIASMPTRRQKSARLVQQAILTCWQLSTSSPVAGS